MDGADTLKLDEAGLRRGLKIILDKVKRIDEDDPDDDADPRIERLLGEDDIITRCLDPIIRERYRRRRVTRR